MKWFNYEKIYLAARGDCSTILKLFREENIPGLNWVLNEEIILNNPLKLTDRQLAEYLGLCALRNYSDYTLYKSKDLDLYMLPPWIPDIVILENPLITKTKTHLIFEKENK